eukprot:SAG31_NODE_674_length_12909_cov_25.961124_11_plen_98_part_00
MKLKASVHCGTAPQADFRATDSSAVAAPPAAVSTASFGSHWCAGPKNSANAHPTRTPLYVASPLSCAAPRSYGNQGAPEATEKGARGGVGGDDPVPN